MPSRVEKNVRLAQGARGCGGLLGRLFASDHPHCKNHKSTAELLHQIGYRVYGGEKAKSEKERHKDAGPRLNHHSISINSNTLAWSAGSTPWLFGEAL